MAKREPGRKDLAKAVGASGVWIDGLPGQTWSDGKADHTIVGLVFEGFDAVCNGKPENYRLRWHDRIRDEDLSEKAGEEVLSDVEMILEEDEIAAVSAWKRKV